MNHKEIHIGVSGRGTAIWLVVTVDDTGTWRHTERFTNESEAISWFKYA